MVRASVREGDVSLDVAAFLLDSGTALAKCTTIDEVIATVTSFAVPRLAAEATVVLGECAEASTCSRLVVPLTTSAEPVGSLILVGQAVRLASVETVARSLALSAGLAIERVTTRRQSEHARGDRLDRLRAVMEATNDIVWDWDLATDHVTFSDSVETALGHRCPEQGFTGTWWLERVHPEDRPRIEQAVAALLASPDSRWHGEYRFQRGDGSYATILDRGTVVRSGSEVTRFVGAMIDLTPIRTSEAALATRTRELRAIIDAFPDLYVWTDADGRVLDFHAGRDNQLGVSAEAMVGKTGAELVPGPKGVAFDVAVKRALETQSIVAIEYDLPTAIGTKWFEARYVPVGVDRTIGIVRDITERYTAQEAARRVDEQYRLVTDGVPVMIAFVDREERYQFVNRGYEDMFERPREWFIGRHMSEVLDPTSYAIVEAHLARLWAGESVNFENVLVLPRGRKRHFSVSWVPHRDATGTVQGYYALIVDVTERRVLEQQLRHSQKMEAIGRLAGGVAHDFNNLLMVIGTAAEFARRAVHKGQDPGPDLDDVEDAAHRAATLTRQLLSFSRRDAARLEPLDFDDVVQQTEKMLRRMIGEDISLRMVLRAAHGAVLADRGQLEQVIVNLVVNARDAMPGGGTLSLHTARRRVDDPKLGVEPGEYVELTVIDTGVGVDEDIRDRIFEPFFTTKDVNKGTGLGLATVYGIVSQSRGTVTFDSKRGHGSTFRVLLPVTAEAARSPAARDTRLAARNSKGRVLLIEDERMVRMLVKRALEHLGYAVSDASDGADALAFASGEHEPFDLVVTDVIMPTISGRAVVERLRERQPDLPALFISGYPEEHMTGVPLDGTTCNAFLAKPFSVHDLLVALEDLTQRTRALGA